MLFEPFAVKVALADTIGFTVTVVCAVTEPEELVAVIVYVVVCVGLTEIDVPVTEPTPFIEIEVAPVIDHDKVVGCPLVMVDCDAPNVVIAGIAGVESGTHCDCVGQLLASEPLFTV
jgi:uncharacterized Zn-binding protein involved in type VI secretion